MRRCSAFRLHTANTRLKFGGGYNRYIKNQQLFGNTNGNFNFADNWDDKSWASRRLSGLTGDSYIDFLLGLSTNYAQLQDQDIRHYVNQTVSAYAMDNWHVTQSPERAVRHSL